MSKRTVFIVAMVLTVFSVGGCAPPSSFIGYFENRRQDLIDVAHVDFSAVNVGAVAYAGPLMVGINYMTGVVTREEASSLQLGLGGPRLLGRKGLAYGIIWTSSRWNDERPIIGQRPKRAPSGLSVGATAGAILGVGAEADVLELIDFITGIFCLDPTEDDEFVAAREEPVKPPQPPPPPPPVPPTPAQPPQAQPAPHAAP